MAKLRVKKVRDVENLFHCSFQNFISSLKMVHKTNVESRDIQVKYEIISRFWPRVQALDVEPDSTRGGCSQPPLGLLRSSGSKLVIC